MKSWKTLLDASVYMYDLTNFTRLADKPQFVEGGGEGEGMATLKSQASSVYFSETFCAMNHSNWSMTRPRLQ